MNIYTECLNDGIDPDAIELESIGNIKGFIEVADEINKSYQEKAKTIDDFENPVPLEPKENPEDKLWAKHFERKYKNIFGD
jgi:hypothetical protein